MKNFSRMRVPRPRSKVYDLYWTFAFRRQEVFERRIRGVLAPWTDDPILKTFKFCNVFRAADRVSQYLIQEIAYGSHYCDPEDRLFQIVAFRTFSSPRTWDAVCDIIGRVPTLEDLESGAFENALEAQKNKVGGLYTGAFILCATKAYGFNAKHQNHVALFKDMFLKNDLGKRIRHANSLEQIVQLLQSFPLMGPFMSYQTAIDVNYSEIVDFSENDYSQAGPGALRGIRKAFEDLGDYSTTDIIHWMVDRQHQEFDRLGLPFKGLWGRPLHAIDAQGLFCELDKYCREAAPELVSARSRIKARFKPSRASLSLFFPPQWGLNEYIDCCGLTGSDK
jgi:hypothetical protein